MYDLHDATRTFRQGSAEIRAVDGISLHIDEGEFLSVVGPSGSGKTTLLQLLGGLDHPTSGEVRFEGLTLATMPEPELTRLRLETFGFVFQQFNLIPTLTAEQNVLAALAPRQMSPYERREAARTRLEEVGLLDRADHLPGELSGGEQQRVAIARAVVNEPRVILGDEPTGNLDTKTGKEIIELLQWMCDGNGATLVIATHDRTITRASTNVLNLEDGREVRKRARAGRSG